MRRLSDLEIRSMTEAEQQHRILHAALITMFTHEERMDGMTPEQRMQGIPPEERIRGLTEYEVERLRELLNKRADAS